MPILDRLPSLQVSEYESRFPQLISYLRHQVCLFHAGKLANYLDAWKTLTSNQEILTTITGKLTEFKDKPVQTITPAQPHWNGPKSKFLDNEIESPLLKGVITHSTHEPGEFISPVLLRDKRDGSLRMILNLKSLNQHVAYHHFKMDTLWTSFSVVKPGCYMASIDLQDAYYCVLINKQHQQYLNFLWKGKLYQFPCYPNGLASCPRKFTKMKPVHSTLRKAGHLSRDYIDDSCLQGDDYNQGVENIKATVTLFSQMELVVHPEKSALYPTQRIVFPGFKRNLVSKTTSLTPEKAHKVKEVWENLLKNTSPSIRKVAKVLGLLTSSLPAVMYGLLHYRWMDMNKSQALKTSNGQFDKSMHLSDEATTDLKWWVHSID